MPELCRFHGIVIQIYYNDHAPAHFHAKYGGYKAKFAVETLGVLNGRLPARQRRIVLRWASIRQEELREAWQRAQRLEHPGRIAPIG
jgi:hypothetical protein